MKLTRTALAGALAALVLATPLTVASAQAAAAPAPVAASPSEAVVAASPKVVIVVGATESTTASYRTSADAIAAEAIKWTPNVVKVYSPYATWSVVAAAAQGASVLVYLGHGNGFPSPYTSVIKPDTEDGMGLNTTMGLSDSDKQYYGESYIAAGIRLAPNAVVFLQNLCYAPGAGEPGAPEPTLSVAQQRVDNFASGFIRAGARSVFAGDGSYVAGAIHSLFTTHAPILSLFRQGYSYNGNEIPFAPARNPAFQGILDPNTWTTGFQHSVVADPALTTDDVLAGSGQGQTNVAPPALTAPGAASVITSGLPLDTTADLTTASGPTFPTGTKLRIDAIVPSTTAPDGTVTPTAVQVHTFDASASGWVNGAGLAPADSASPALRATTGPTTISPNFDGVADQLTLWARLSEPAPWTWTLTDPGGSIVRTLTGTTDLFALSWDAKPGGVAAPAGTYHWSLHAADAWGNPALDAGGDVTVVTLAVPATAVLSFVSLSGAATAAATQAFRLTFAAAVTGLTAADLSSSGSATGCLVGSPTGSGTTWDVTVSGCTPGTEALVLAPNSVADASSTRGPSTAVSSSVVIIDRTKPVALAPRVDFKTGVAIAAGTSSMPAGVTIAATDSGGAGLLNYDLARSIDGAAFVVIATGLVSSPFGTTVGAHSYRFEVRARDRAGNIGSWVAGPTIYPALVQQTSTAARWSGTWTTWYVAAYSGGSSRVSSTASSAGSYTFTGRAIAVVASRDPHHGQLRVYVDGTYIATIDTFASVHQDRVIVFARALSYATHTIKLVVVGTSGRPQVVVDAFEVVR